MGKIKIESSIIEQAKSGNKEALKKMFQTFLAEDENIISAEYLGCYGIFFTTKSFVCITDKKVASLEYGPFSKIIYSDALIEDVNSGVIYQPSIFMLYFVGIILCISLFGIILLNSWIRFYYKVNKSGMLWYVREGISIYAFANRSKINLVNEIWRKASYIRNKRKYTI